MESENKIIEFLKKAYSGKNLIINIVGGLAIIAAIYLCDPDIFSFTSSSSSSSYKEEIKALGFPTNEIDYWIDNAMDQYNCTLVEVTSVEADDEWCLKLYMDVLWYHTFRDKGEPHKGVLSLYFEPSDGSVWSADFEPLD